MLETKKTSFQSNHTQKSYKPDLELHLFPLKSTSHPINPKTSPHHIDLQFKDGQSLICYGCGNGNHRNQCQQCFGKGYVNSDHPLVTLMNDIFNIKLIQTQITTNKKTTFSTKTSSKSSASDSFSQSEFLNTSTQANNHGEQKKPSENHRSSILDFLLTPLQTIIKEESTTQDKWQKCNICHYQFDAVKYKCQSCENYNVCQSCYLTKHIDHCHGLKKMQSVTSQKEENVERDSESLKNSRFQVGGRQEVENTHSDVDKLSFKSDDSVELMFKGLEMKRQQKLLQSKNIELPFFQLYQIEGTYEASHDRNAQQKKNCESCCNCHYRIDQCYWICQTCSHQGLKYWICKFCYDSNIFNHPSNHHLGLNFFAFDLNFIENETGIYHHLSEGTSQSYSKQIMQNDRPNSALNQNSLGNACQKRDENILSIGVIGHRDIFTGFHKGSPNDGYPEEIISPIPRSIKLSHSFKDKKPSPSPESDRQFIAEFIKSPPSSIAKNSLEPQQITVKDFNDQSRVQIDENLINDLGISTEYNRAQNLNLISPKGKRLGPTQKELEIQTSNLDSSGKPQSKQSQLMTVPDSDCFFQSVIEINPQTSILDVNQGEFLFDSYYCDICGSNPIKNVKYHCLECQDYDLCSDCYENKRLEHWHNHFRKEEGAMKVKKIREDKEKMIKKVVENSLNRSISPTRRSIRLMK